MNENYIISGLNQDAVTLKGNWDASSGTFPASTKKGDSYIVSVSGTVDGVLFSVNDRLLSLLDNASTTTYASNWLKLDYSDQVLSVNTQTGNVVLDADDISDVGTTNKYTTAADLSKLAGIETGADVTDAANVAAAGAVMEADYSHSHSVLVQQGGTGNPQTVNFSNNTILGKAGGGDLDALTATEVRTMINVADGARSATQVTSITLLVGSWSLVSGLYEYDLSNANITAASIVDIIPDNADIDIVKDAEILPRTESSSGAVKLFATNAPSGDIGVTINIWK